MNLLKDDVKLTETINFCDPIDESEGEDLDDSFKKEINNGEVKSKCLVEKGANQRKRGVIHKRSLSDF